jgi:hypothetical protein
VQAKDLFVSLYAKKEKLATAFMGKHFRAGQTTTGRSEIENYLVKRWKVRQIFDLLKKYFPKQKVSTIY